VPQATAQSIPSAAVRRRFLLQPAGVLLLPLVVVDMVMIDRYTAEFAMFLSL
jgi:hypothetical protein